MFSVDAAGASEVYIAGQFNNWAPPEDKMMHTGGGIWETTLALRPGRYEYKYVIDGATCKEDAGNPLWVPDPYGGRNSVVYVLEDGSPDFKPRPGDKSTDLPIAPDLPALAKPLHLAIVWHQLQPKYFKSPETGEYLERWVRVHGIKDYYDMVAMLGEYPHMKFTVNLTPVLLAQLEEVILGYDRYKAAGLRGRADDGIGRDLRPGGGSAVTGHW